MDDRIQGWYDLGFIHGYGRNKISLKKVKQRMMKRAKGKKKGFDKDIYMEYKDL